MKERVNWIDAAKGIGIILVILGHISFRPNALNIWLCSFHMPLFFFLAGITYNPKKYSSFKPLLISKIKTIVIPYFIFAVVMWLWKFIMQVYPLLRTGKSMNMGYLFRQGVGIFINIRESAFGPGVWFITCIFIAFLFLFAIMKISKGKQIPALIIASACFAVGYCYCEFIDIKLPWAIDAAAVAVFFMTVGCVFRDKLLALQKPKILPATIRGGVFLLLTVAAAYLNYSVLGRTVGMWSNNYGNPIWFLIAAFAGIGFTVTVAQLISFKYLISVGKNSIFYYGIHIILVEILVKVINRFFGTPVGISAYILSFAVFAVTLGILSLIYPIYDKLYKKLLNIIKI